MRIVLAENHYGKARVRLVKVTRSAGRHELSELTVHVALEGDFGAAHIAGDNSKILPTDTMKNTVYVLAKQCRTDPIENFGSLVAQYFLKNNPQVSGAQIDLIEHLWDRIPVDGQPHPWAFTSRGLEKRVARVMGTRDRTDIESGIEDLVVLKTTESAFAGYIHDAYTTLPEANDRILATVIKVNWSYTDTSGVDFNALCNGVRQLLLTRFAGHKSQSVQHTLYTMGEAVLARYDVVAAMHLTLPNRHCLLVDLSRFGLPNPNEIFQPVDEPHGLMEATVKRG